MRQEATINRNSITINFTVKYCNNAESLLDSDGFKRVLTAFIEKIEKKEAPVYVYIKDCCGKNSNLVQEITKFFKLLIVLEGEEIAKLAILLPALNISIASLGLEKNSNSSFSALS
jgi:hypothetical protein